MHELHSLTLSVWDVNLSLSKGDIMSKPLAKQSNKRGLDNPNQNRLRESNLKEAPQREYFGPCPNDNPYRLF
jgi:hypothetical protein